MECKVGKDEIKGSTIVRGKLYTILKLRQKLTDRGEVILLSRYTHPSN